MKKQNIHVRVKLGIRIINDCILNFIIENNGKTTFKKIEKHTGLNEISNELVAQILTYFIKKKLIKIVSKTTIAGNVANLKEYQEYIRSKNRSHYPDKHGMAWHKTDLIEIAGLYNKGYNLNQIGKVLGRTPTACYHEMHLIRKAHTLVPLLNNNTIKTFVNQGNTPSSKG